MSLKIIYNKLSRSVRDLSIGIHTYVESQWKSPRNQLWTKLVASPLSDVLLSVPPRQMAIPPFPSLIFSSSLVRTSLLCGDQHRKGNLYGLAIDISNNISLVRRTVDRCFSHSISVLVSLSLSLSLGQPAFLCSAASRRTNERWAPALSFFRPPGVWVWVTNDSDSDSMDYCRGCPEFNPWCNAILEKKMQNKSLNVNSTSNLGKYRSYCSDFAITLKQ